MNGLVPEIHFSDITVGPFAALSRLKVYLNAKYNVILKNPGLSVSRNIHFYGQPYLFVTEHVEQHDGLQTSL